MLRRLPTFCLGFCVALSTTSAFGQGLDVSLTGAGGRPIVSLADAPARTPDLDLALFLAELGAYVTKEVLPDSADEFTRSPIPSHLSREMPGARSEFGSHCLFIVGRLGSALPSVPALQGASPSGVDTALRAASGALAVRQIWSAFQNHVEGSRSGISLDPKVSSRRFGLYLTLHF